MSAEIHRLTNAGPVIGEPEKDIVEMLEELMERAKAGALRGFGYFLVDGANSVESGWADGCASADGMVSGASKLQHRVLRAVTE
jgi:hypothetical protein